MKFYKTVRMAVIALKRNVLRSALTTLGIVIGVGAVIAMMEIGQGSSSAIKQTIASMGANMLLVQPGTASSGGVTFGSGSVITLTPEDAKVIVRECPSVANVAPVVRARTQVIYGNHNWVPLYIYGTTPEFLEIRDWVDLDAGEAFTAQDVNSASKVCLLGQTLVRELFGGENPVGKEIRVQNVTFKVVGVLSRKGANMMGLDQDDILLAPWTTIKYRVSGVSASTQNQSANNGASAPGTVNTSVNTLNQLYPVTDYMSQLYVQQSVNEVADRPQPVRFTNVDQIMAQAHSTPEIPQAVEEITGLLHERHHIQSGQPDDFNVRDMTEMTNALASTSKVMSVLLAIVAAISLVVGGVGIMNIMLVSVTERTKEIGLRMAVGARPRDILRQFLVEAIVLCILGGAFGILLGRGISIGVRLSLHWPTEISWLAIILAVLVSALVGVVFGFYPAWKASGLDPIEALRYE
jgi:ABC-type antimicrobial peptide transport system permease subunit